MTAAESSDNRRFSSVRRSASAAPRLGHQDGARARVERTRVFAGGARDRPVHCLEIRHPQQPGDAWGYQRLGDGADNRLSSSSARSSSMRAPAAADAASQASCVSVDDTAFRLTVAARFAIWNAARNSPCAASSSAGGRMTASICPPITRCCSMRGSSSRDGPERSRIWTSSFLASRSSCTDLSIACRTR